MTTWSDTIGALFLAHRQRLESMVTRRIRDRETAADIVQDVFARVLSGGRRAPAEESMRILYASARNAAIEHHRSSTRRARLLSSLLPAQCIAEEVGPDRRLEAKQALSALDAALGELSPRCRDIFIMRRVHGLSNQDIARAHGISVNSVEKHIARALRHCQTYLARHGSQA